MIVGVNRFVDEEETAVKLAQPDYRALEASQKEKLAAFRAARDGSRVRERVVALREAARGTENLMPAIIAAVADGVTLGEISGAFREEWGVYRPG